MTKDLKVPSKKQNETTLRFADEELESHVVITLGNSKAIELERARRDDANKPLYLKRV